MRFIYYSHQTLQVPRVARQCMVSLCDGIAQSGVVTEIVSFRARMHPSEPVHPPFRELYGVEGPLRETSYRIPFVVVDSESIYLLIARLLLYVAHLSWRMINRRGSDLTVVSARNYSVLCALAILRPLFGRRLVVLADVHGLPSTRFRRFVHRRVDGNLCISRALADDLGRQASVSSDRLRVAHSGVKPARFNVPIDRTEARERLGLDPHEQIVCYTGKVYYRYEEISYLVEVAATLPKGVRMLVVGGRPDHVGKWKEECEEWGAGQITFISFVSPSEIPLYMRAADVLVLYYSPSPLNHYRSPGKLFEYLASGTPLVACRTRSISEVVIDGQNGVLVEPYRADRLREAIYEVLGNRPLLQRLAEGGQETALDYTWRHRGAAFIHAACDVAMRRGLAVRRPTIRFQEEYTETFEVS